MSPTKYLHRNIPNRKLDTLLTLGGFFIVGMAGFAKSIFPNGLPFSLEVLALMATLILWGCVGLFWIIRKEGYQIVFKIKGFAAILFGGVIMISCWGGAIYLLIEYFWF